MSKLVSNTTIKDEFSSDYEKLEVWFSHALRETNGKQLYTTDAKYLWESYLNMIPDSCRKHYQCNTCRKFIERYLGLVSVSNTGELQPVFIPYKLDSLSRKTIRWFEVIGKEITRSNIVLPFYTEKTILGTPTTGKWSHFHAHVFNTPPFVGITAEQKQAKMLQEFIILRDTHDTVAARDLNLAISILKDAKLPNSENTLAQAKWLQVLKLKLATYERRDPFLWEAVTSCPAGWCHINTTLLGSLLQEVKNRVPYPLICNKWREWVDPMSYQRPTTLKEGTINEAEKLFAKLGTEKALRRRFARLDEIKTCWNNWSEPSAANSNKCSTYKGVFDKLRHSEPLRREISWDEFKVSVLPTAIRIRLAPPPIGNYFSFVTAAVENSPVFLRWDIEEERNPFSWYVYHGGARAINWFTTVPAQVEVTAICENPATWGGYFSGREPKLFLCLAKCKDYQYQAGGLFFPDMLKNEYHPVRAALEAYSNKSVIEDLSNSEANGICLSDTSIVLEVRDHLNHVREYILKV